MRGDFSGREYDPKTRYSGVEMQQGEVQRDADSDTQQESAPDSETRERRGSPLRGLRDAIFAKLRK